MTIRQGSIDCLCGVYSVLNATEILIGKFKYDRKLKKRNSQKMALFSDLLGYLAKNNRLKQALTKGINQIDHPGGLLDIAVKSVGKYQKQRMRKQTAFDRNPATSDEYWEKLTNHLMRENSSVIILLTGRIEHWTCVKRITQKTLILSDSIGMKYIHRQHCAVGEGEKGSYTLWPTMTYLLSLE